MHSSFISFKLLHQSKMPMCTFRYYDKSLYPDWFHIQVRFNDIPINYLRMMEKVLCWNAWVTTRVYFIDCAYLTMARNRLTKTLSLYIFRYKWCRKNNTVSQVALYSTYIIQWERLRGLMMTWIWECFFANWDKNTCSIE